MSMLRCQRWSMPALLILALGGRCCAAPLTGHVVDPSGKPVAGASVYVSHRFPPEDTNRITTDAAGSFATSAPDGAGAFLYCVIDARGFAPSGGTLIAGASNTFQLGPPVTVAGTVADAQGRPVSGAVVMAVSAAAPDNASTDNRIQRFTLLGFGPLKDRYTTRTDAQGNYALAGLPGNALVTLMLHDPRFADQTVTTAKGAAAAAQILARPGAAVRGRVVYKGGAPAAGFDVIAQPATPAHSWTGESDKTAADGSYEIYGLSPGPLTVGVETMAMASSVAAPWVAPAGQPVTASAGTIAAAPDIVLTHGGVVTGSIVDSDTKGPVKDVVVGVQIPAAAGLLGATSMATTDAQGHYALHVPPGADTFFVSQAPEDYVVNMNDTRHSFTIQEGQTLALEPVVLKRALTISADLVDEAGNAVPDTSIQMQMANYADGWVSLPRETADKAGHITFHQLTANTYSMDPSDPWTIVSPATLTAPAAAPVKIVLKKRPVTTLQGSVADLSGAPLANVDLTFVIDHSLSNGSREGGEYHAASGADGKYTVAGAPQDTTDIQFSTAAKAGYLLQTSGVITKAGDTLVMSPTVLAQLGGEIDGVVRNSSGGVVAGAWVVCPEAGKDAKPVRSDAHGGFKLTGLIVGPADVYAAESGCLGHQVVQTMLSAVSTAIRLAPVAAPGAADPAAAADLMQNVQSTGEGSTGGNAMDPGWRRQLCANDLAANDPEDGLEFLENYSQDVNAGAVRQLIDARAALDPAAAAAWGVPQIKEMPDSDDKSGAAMELGLAIAPYDRKTASMLYDLARTHIAVGSIDDSSVYNAMDITALAAALGRPEAADLFQKTGAGIAELVKNARPQPGGYSEADWLQQNFAQVMALGSTALTEQVLDSMPLRKREDAIPQVIAKLVVRDPAGALEIFHTLHPDKDGQIQGDFDTAQRIVLPVLCKNDPAGAQAIAEAVADPQEQAQDLLIIADMLPMDLAGSVYQEAESKSVDQGGRGATPACIATHAWTRDRQLGAKLYEEAYSKVITASASDQPWQGPSYAEFAFYYARVDPAFSRLLLEQQFIQDQQTPGNSGAVTADAAAMAAVNVDRAMEMARTIKDAYSQFMAALKVAQFMLAPQAVRDTLPFDRWTAGDSWTPGTPTGW